LESVVFVRTAASTLRATSRTSLAQRQAYLCFPGRQLELDCLVALSTIWQRSPWSILSRFTGRAHEHEGKLIELILLSWRWGLPITLYPSAPLLVLIRGKPATDPLNRDIS
jgi:hypothetical protein